MNKNMNSPSKLTEFAPLSPEESQPGVASLFSKFFNFTKGSQNVDDSTISSTNEEQSSSDSESWKQSESTEKSPEDDNSSMMNFPLDSCEGRSLPNVLKRISNIVALKSNNLRSYKDSQLRSYWMPDSVSKQCYECGERFTTFRRRHHCRVCGQIFCSKCCSDQIPGKIMGCTGDLRVCTYCCKVVLSYLQSSDMRSDLSADLKALLEAGFIEPVLADNEFSDTAAVFKPVKLSNMQSTDLLTETQNTCDAQEPAWVKTIPQHDSTTDSESET
uniref:1-phosphatidylinositol-3-phosphate 5-kinase n=1 Tax=Apis cerana TaxID=7461 RepID=V9IJF6_APICE